ncbi:MAG: hypothetical protein WBA93_07945 [Microcoleaceae cyanobacterium]
MSKAFCWRTTGLTLRDIKSAARAIYTLPLPDSYHQQKQLLLQTLIIVYVVLKTTKAVNPI